MSAVFLDSPENENAVGKFSLSRCKEGVSLPPSSAVVKMEGRRRWKDLTLVFRRRVLEELFERCNFFFLDFYTLFLIFVGVL